ncbi:MAG TPA: Crp/Fnr family transcriptional regulator [Steroidobacteraceae bacterium]|nr:Crp/Fnr family transcriptional regulator [Steroidobacteraceae bacterium]
MRTETTSNLAQTLAQSPLCAGLAQPALKEMASHFTGERWPARTQIAAPAQTAEQFRIITRGRVKIARSHPGSGRNLTLWLLGPGDAFDVVSLLDGEPHEVTAWSLDEVQTLCVPLARFRRWLERSPALRAATYAYVAERFRELSELAGELALHDTLTRLGRRLLHHFDDQHPKAKSAALIHDLPQEELASLIGSVRVVVSRLLAQLKRDSIIKLDRRALQVMDLKRLLRRIETQLPRTPRQPRTRQSSGR